MTGFSAPRQMIRRIVARALEYATTKFSVEVPQERFGLIP